ncbi:hypothetical protein JCM11491_006802 [Sporobolomyces phaffii]
MLSQHALHRPRYVLPVGPRTVTHFAHSVNPLTSNRHAHLTRLYSVVVHLLSLAPSYATSTRLLRAWRALAGCKEVHLGVLWRTGTAVLERMRGRNGDDDDDADAAADRHQRQADWLKFVQEGQIDKVDKFNEYILALVAAGSARFALDELESYLDNQPYHDSITLNTLSALLSLLLAQPGPAALPPRPLSPTSSEDDDEDENGRKQGGRNSKRLKVTEGSSRADSHDGADDDLLPFLQNLSRNSPALFSKAKERFKRAAQLAERDYKENHGESEHVPEDEAGRWLGLIARSEKFDQRDGSPA